MDVSVVIPTYKRKDTLARCIYSLSCQDYPKEKFEIIIVDDNPEEAADFAKNLPKEIKYFRNGHRGISAARNFGIKKAEGNIIAFIDDDCVAASNWVSQVVRCHNIQPQIRVIQGAIGNYSLNNLWARSLQASFDAHFSGKDEFDYINQLITSNASFKKEVFEKIGGFDEKLPRCVDYDLASQLKNKGENIIYAPGIFVYHFHRLKFSELAVQQFNLGRCRFQVDHKWESKLDNSASFKKRLGFWVSEFRRAGLNGGALFIASLARKTLFISGYLYERYFCFDCHPNP